MKCAVRAAYIAVLMLIPGVAASQSRNAFDDPWSFSMGFDTRNLDLNTRDRGVEAQLVANLTRSWRTGVPGLTVQTGLSVGMDAPRHFTLRESGTTVRTTRRHGAFTGGLSYEFLRRAPVRPYISAGGGVYRITMRSRPDCVTAACTPTDVALFHRGYTRTTLGINGAIGLRARLFNRELFVEQGYHAFQFRRIDEGVIPLNIGIRF